MIPKLKVGCRVVVLEGVVRDAVPEDEIGTIQKVLSLFGGCDARISASKNWRGGEWCVSRAHIAPLREKGRKRNGR